MIAEQLTISIPVELATYAVWQRKLVNKYETNQLIKAFDTWLVLKADSVPSYIQSWNQQKQHLLRICKCSEAIFRHRMKILSSLKLLSFDRYAIRLCSWEKLADVLEIDIKEKFTVQYDITDKKRIQEWLIATEIQENQSRQNFKIMQKLDKNPDLKLAVIAELIHYGADHAKLSNPQYFLSMMRAIYYNDFVQASEIHDVLIEVRPDNNRGVRSMAQAWKCKHPTTVSYWKKVMAKSGVIDVAKLQIQSHERVRNKQCRVVWLKGIQQTLLCLCDQITVLKPWIKWEEKPQKKAA
jgi:hypothetical protein